MPATVRIEAAGSVKLCPLADRPLLDRRMLTEHVKVRYTQPTAPPPGGVAPGATPPLQQLIPQANGAVGGAGQQPQHQQHQQHQPQPRAMNGAAPLPHAPLQELPPRPAGPAPAPPPQPQQPPPAPQVSHYVAPQASMPPVRCIPSACVERLSLRAMHALSGGLARRVLQKTVFVR